MEMTPGISTGLFYDSSILEALPLIREAGFETVEIWAGTEKYGASTHFDWHKERQITALEICLKGLGISVASLHSPFSEMVDLSSPDESMRLFSVEEIERSMYCMKRLGGRCLVVHPASTGESLKDGMPIRFSQCRKSMEYLYVRAQDLGVKIALETQLPHIFGGDSAALYRIAEGFSPAVCGFCFDTSHVNLWKKGALRAFDDLSLRINSLHVSDNNGSADDHLVPGDGEINWRELIFSIKKSGCCDVLMLEVLCGDTGMSARDILAKSRKVAQRLAAGLSLK